MLAGNVYDFSLPPSMKKDILIKSFHASTIPIIYSHVTHRYASVCLSVPYRMMIKKCKAGRKK